MALNKQSIDINFSQGLDTKTDAYQVQIGKFLTLTNSVFDTANRLTKRNGFQQLTPLDNEEQTTLCTLNGNLIATGSSLYAFSDSTDQWINQGTIQPVNLDVLPLVRVSTSQSSADAAITPQGLTCVAYIDSNGSLYYHIVDGITGQQIVPRTLIVNGVASPRCFKLKNYFIVTYIATITAVHHLQYIAIPISDITNPRAPADISTTLTATTAGYDCHVANDTLYIGWADVGTTVYLTFLTSTLILASPQVIAAHTATLMSITADSSGSTPVIWMSFWDSSSNDGYTTAYNYQLNSTPILAVTQIITDVVINQITSVADAELLTVIYENQNNYNSTGAYPTASVKTDYLSKLTVTQAGVVGSPSSILRSVGLGSKAFFSDAGAIYMLATYGEANQPTYFLIDSTGAIYMRLAYSNGGGYESNQVLPSVTQVGSQYLVPYLIKDFLTTVNKGTNIASGTQVNSIYTQTGINLAKISINASGQYSSEIAGALHLTGGQLWEYDGVKPVEHGFHVWPENVAITTSTSGGSIAAGTYYHSFTYEWTDNQGMLHRSAPSIPIKQVTTGSTSTNTLYVPTLRLTSKVTPNPVRIVGYRWSVAQPIYYQFTSLTAPAVNDPTVDYVTIIDTKSDAQILGQTPLYTNGGVLENIASPAPFVSALFKNRLFIVDSEDRNLLWFSKQVIQNTPVEMSDLLTIYVAPTSGAQGSTGDISALAAMDDKLIIFKSDAIYYLTGTGPDNTGANNDFSDPVFITSSVGCANPNSIVLMPTGIMFQSDKGIWLLSRDLQTTYVGAPVEQYNANTVRSALNIPGTNQIRFILDNNLTLMYDYYFGQWGTFTNIKALSSTLYQGFHTYLNSLGQIFQETPNYYLDGSTPVLMSFTTSWINLAGVQGYERFYFMHLLGTFKTPFKLNVQLAYDYASSFTQGYNSLSEQSVIVNTANYSAPWGGEQLWGSGDTWGGPNNTFEARVFPAKQKCESFQIVVNELYDNTYGVRAGEGLTLSGLNLTVGMKKGYRVSKASRSFG